MADAEPSDERSRPWGALPWLREAVAELSMAALEHAAERAMTVESLTLELPLELALDVDERGGLRVRGAPPTQRTETTFMPVQHRLRVRIVEGDGADG
ncbi:MAG: hypothetical protein KDK70_16920 [Myxococcales bacterium]|nr:hypothetical protein [Myxococcales bacterium]